MDVVTKVLGHIDLPRARGLEIGALHNPRLRRDQADVRYVDRASTAALREYYADDAHAGPQADQMVDVDYVWVPGQNLADVVAADSPFDFVIASHVIEHVPDVIGWLGQIADVLVDDGVLSLVIPDKRYCFDVNRSLTTMADLVDGYLEHRLLPSVRQIYDHEVNYLPEETAILWQGADTGRRRRDDVEDADRYAFECARAQCETGTYRDVHCSTFTPASFLDLWAAMARLDLVPFDIAACHATEVGDYEFFVTLRKVAPSTAEEVRRKMQLASVAAWSEVLGVESTDPGPAGPAAEPPRGSGGSRPVVSDKEMKMIEAKRVILERVRALVGSLRSPAGR